MTTSPKKNASRGNSISTTYCHQKHEMFSSPLTGHAILVNTSDEKHLLPPREGFKANLVQEVAKLFLLAIKNKSHPFVQATDRDLSLLLQLSGVEDFTQYAQAIDDITSDFDPARAGGPVMETLSLKKEGGRGNGREPAATARKPETAFFKMSAVLLRLWSFDQLGLCPKWSQSTRQFCELNQDACGRKISLRDLMAPTFATLPDESSVRRMDGMLFRFAACSIGLSHIDDIVPGAVPKYALAMLSNRLSQLLKLIRANQCLRHDPLIVPQTPLWHGKAGKSQKGDHALEWANSTNYPELSGWHSNLAEWILKRASPGPGTRCAEFILNYLIDSPQVARTPEEFLSRSYSNPFPINARLADRFQNTVALKDVTNLCHEFFDWMLIEKLSALNDLGRPIPSPSHWNPIARLVKSARPIQTHREAIPTRFIKEMIEIITENDWAWPKTISYDYFPYLNKSAGEWSRVWSPVRATAMLLKLLLPLRTYQVCMLDSGELDEEVYIDGAWVQNASPIKIKKRRAGVLRKFLDHATGRVNTGFFINTNKTADKGKDPKAIGYEIPWQHEDAIDALAKLASWQRDFNSLAKPQYWRDVRNKDTLKVLTQESLARRGEIAFLFRDPTGNFVNDPLSVDRVNKFWGLLLRELEKRLEKRGEVLPDGSPVQFLIRSPRKDRSGEQLSPMYDLHSLRVSIITSLATDGGVPIPILSKCIAGHASILMTLYYVKVGAAMVNEELALAQKRIDEKEQESFKRFIVEREAKAFRPFVLTNDDAGFSALEQKNAQLWSINDKGLCPVGGSLCHIGGKKITANVTAADYAPVPGGPRNCVRCRFFVTGPAFLGGLVAHFNAVGIELMEASDRHRQKEAAIQKLEDELYELGGNDSKLLDKIKMAQDRQEEEMKEVDAIAGNWHAIYAFIERSKAIIARSGTERQSQSVQLTPSDPMSEQRLAQAQNIDELGAQQNLNKQGELSLVLGGDEVDFGVVMQEASRFETFNSVCQMAVAYPAEKAIPLANLRRSKLLDAMLSRNNCNPVFASLSDEEAMAVGNQLSTLLIARLGRVETANLIEGRRMLESSGVFKDVQDIVKKHASLGFLPKDAQATPTPAKKLGRPRKSTENDKESS